MKKIYLLLIALLCGATVYGQNASIVDAGYSAEVEKNHERVDTDFDIDMSHLKLRRQEMITITPAILSNDSKESVEFSPVVVAGSKRYKHLKRSQYFHETKLNPQPVKIIKYKKKDTRHLLQAYSTAYQPWMRNASLHVHEHLSGCTKCKTTDNDILLIRQILPPAFIPTYRVTYVTPPAEEVKQRSENFVAHINYEVGKHTVLRNYKNNASELDQVDKIMRELMNDKDLTVTRFEVTGYASPDGNFNSNQTLSENRAKAFLDYLKQHYGANVSSAHSVGKGEDWEGLYKAVEASDIADRSEILTIININSDIVKRKQAIQRLSGGRTYRTLLNEFYPPLRRNEVEVSFVARPFDVYEAREIILTRPQLLSLNEMFLVANSYPKGSEEFKNVFDIAARMYPNDINNMINNAALEIESGSYDKAVSHLEGLNNADALNNLGVAYANKGEIERAESYFRRAADAGSVDAKHNLDQLTQYKNDR